MGSTTGIEWTQHTFNPWWGCTKVSPGCAHCYAEALARRYGHDVWGNRLRRRFGTAHWQQPLRWNALAEADGRQHRVFCASMADVFDEGAPASELPRLWALIESTPALDWQILTKRPHRISEVVPPAWRSDPQENVWLGTSIESPDVLGRVADLVASPAVLRFLSVEPLLEAIPDLPLDGIDWVIVGGESGGRARPMEADWVRAIRDRCLAQGVAFFFKQWGGAFNKQKGRILDGRTWDERPNGGAERWATRRVASSSTRSAHGRSARTGS